MQLSSLLCAFNLLNCYIISAHPSLYPKNLAKREIEGVAVATQIHHLNKRMEPSSSGVKKLTDEELLAAIKAKTAYNQERLDQVESNIAKGKAKLTEMQREVLQRTGFLATKTNQEPNKAK
ncbi:hypothetical protein PGT21_019559 [Puccinia graminis f. sp. tritici]|uniref:Uncharacterized protein n=1 Tax=Puccinia graminis f. sp. tritici TaxID=56615 RepID=A0A5B0NSA2_PUCGR|nr:hypothetical protein PGT21_019559 [Puccinia graminis f. sp. tritici]KAA1092115.1 hypothetical protein PGTUg99_021169 [Puccinia graminis f. sp. tritici]